MQITWRWTVWIITLWSQQRTLFLLSWRSYFITWTDKKYHTYISRATQAISLRKYMLLCYLLFGFINVLSSVFEQCLDLSFVFWAPFFPPFFLSPAIQRLHDSILAATNWFFKHKISPVWLMCRMPENPIIVSVLTKSCLKVTKEAQPASCLHNMLKKALREARNAPEKGHWANGDSNSSVFSLWFIF